MLSHEAAACLEVALEANGLKNAYVRKSGLITFREYGHKYVFCNPELGLSALPLGHALHIALTGDAEPIFTELFERALQRADIEEAERFFHNIDDADASQVERLLSVVVERYKYRLIRYNMNITVARRTRLELIGQSHAA